MKRAAAIIVIVFCTLGAESNGCESKSEIRGESVLKVEPLPEKPAIPEIIKYDFSKTVTVGNHSYIPINMYSAGSMINDIAKPANHIKEILGLIDAFEKEHPEFEITNWHIEKDQQAHSTSATLYGLWVDHRPSNR